MYLAPLVMLVPRALSEVRKEVHITFIGTLMADFISLYTNCCQVLYQNCFDVCASPFFHLLYNKCIRKVPPTCLHTYIHMYLCMYVCVYCSFA